MDLERIEALLQLLRRQAHVGEVIVEGEGWRLQARSGPYGPTFSDEPEPPGGASVSSRDEGRHIVRAGVVGIYRAPQPPVRPGDFIAAGATFGSIDSMRILISITVEEGGQVLEALVEDGDPVEYGQELFVLERQSVSEAGAH